MALGVPILKHFRVHLTELQIRGGIEDNSKVIFLTFLTKTLCCDPS